MSNQTLEKAIAIHDKKNAELLKYLFTHNFKQHKCSKEEQKNAAKFVAYKSLPPPNRKILVISLLAALVSAFKLPYYFSIGFLLGAVLSLIPLGYRYWQAGIVAKNLKNGNYTAYYLDVDRRVFYRQGKALSFVDDYQRNNRYSIEVQEQVFLINRLEFISFEDEDRGLAFIVNCGKHQRFAVYSTTHLKTGIIPRYFERFYID